MTRMEVFKLEVVKTTMITGVAGTTGSQILDYLSETEEVKSGKRQILGVDNYFRGTEENIKNHLGKDYFSFVNRDFRDFCSCSIDKSVDIDEIYHMAAIVPTRYFYERPDLTYEVNCKGTIDLFNWARNNHIKRFIVGSSSEIYGHLDMYPASEDAMSIFNSVESSTRWSYAEGKLLTEHYLNHFCKDFERVCHLRFANTYGASDLDDNHIIPYLINRIIKNEDIHINKECRNYKRSFLNNKDSSRACIELMNKGRNGVAYNVGSDYEISIYDLKMMIENLVKEITGNEYTGEVFYDVERPGDPMRRLLSTQRLKEDTGFVPKVSLEKGLKEMINKVLKVDQV